MMVNPRLEGQHSNSIQLRRYSMQVSHAATAQKLGPRSAARWYCQSGCRRGLEAGQACRRHFDWLFSPGLPAVLTTIGIQLYCRAFVRCAPGFSIVADILGHDGGGELCWVSQRTWGGPPRALR
jgi:hypothetical protein